MDDAILAASAEAGYLILFDEFGKGRVSLARTASRENINK